MNIISVSHLTKYYQVLQKEPGLSGSLKSLFNPQYNLVNAVNDLSFTLQQGELVGFIGPNGAGKTTTLKVLSGLLYPTSGEVSVLGFTPFERNNTYLKSISLVMGQKNQLWWDLPPIDTFHLNKEIYEVSDQEFQRTVSEMTHLLNIEQILKTPVRKLSLGQRMKCELVAALIHRPQVLFLDEPTIGLDVVMQKTLRDFIKEYNRKYQATILLTSHYMEDVKELCKRVIIIDKGRIIYDGSLSKITQKFATNKKITLVLAKEIDLKSLAQVTEIKEVEFPQVILNVPRNKVSQVTAKLLQKFPVADLNIEEEQIEDVIRKIFSGRELS